MTDQNKRRYYRLKNGVKVAYKVTGQPSGNEFQSLDLGGGGVRAWLPERIFSGTTLDISLLLPLEAQDFKALARVAWQLPVPKKEKNGKEYFETGIEFLRMNLKDRLQIIHYVHTRIKKDNIKF
jgi:c-di-GMP-binding flagellar brake protein YcgR